MIWIRVYFSFVIYSILFDDHGGVFLQSPTQENLQKQLRLQRRSHGSIMNVFSNKQINMGVGSHNNIIISYLHTMLGGFRCCRLSSPVNNNKIIECQPVSDPITRPFSGFGLGLYLRSEKRVGKKRVSAFDRSFN